ncbi:MAG TPA: YraN family protein [Mesotoga sp.]|jgi:putative endonuclease|nr:YraN family protein [Mesotoga sp.]NLX34109.1 YraN family protein [Thermotogaceae bacterium]MDD4040435.1 YraN family protein [Mesotoga sp.]MDD4478474.1 YraN family protein [Mesotoga sp.]MDD5744197.1 YraN family protein [Mesotoga sp.]
MSRELGRQFEELACAYLKNTGYRIVARNVSYRFGELDIVAYDGRVLVFVEVKGGNGFSPPRYRVDERKLRHLEMAANRFIAQERPKFDEIRLDVVEVLNTGEINHIKSVGRW